MDNWMVDCERLSEDLAKELEEGFLEGQASVQRRNGSTVEWLANRVIAKLSRETKDGLQEQCASHLVGDLEAEAKDAGLGLLLVVRNATVGQDEIADAVERGKGKPWMENKY